MPPEIAAQVGRILEAQALGNASDRQFAVAQPRLDLQHHLADTLPLGQRTDLQAHGFVLIQKPGYAVHEPIRPDSGSQRSRVSPPVVKSTEGIKARQAAAVIRHRAA
ncbi:hypothetical protein G6F57_014751 [Rhizopus arrhizus]|nr:hypothetical protein G6F57_014751 [Rhizopus arrhizus]